MRYSTMPEFAKPRNPESNARVVARETFYVVTSASFDRLLIGTDADPKKVRVGISYLEPKKNTTQRMVAALLMTPLEARKLAADILKSADDADRMLLQYVNDMEKRAAEARSLLPTPTVERDPLGYAKE